MITHEKGKGLVSDTFNYITSLAGGGCSFCLRCNAATALEYYSPSWFI